MENIAIKAKLTLSKRPYSNSVSKSLIIKSQKNFCRKFNNKTENVGCHTTLGKEGINFCNWMKFYYIKNFKPWK